MIRLRLFLGLALGWLFSSSVLVNNSVKVMSNNFGFEKDQCEDEKNVRRGLSMEKYLIVIGFL